MFIVNTHFSQPADPSAAKVFCWEDRQAFEAGTGESDLAFEAVVVVLRIQSCGCQ